MEKKRARQDDRLDSVAAKDAQSDATQLTRAADNTVGMSEDTPDTGGVTTV
ncbi:hypothetical protein ACFFQF_22975 [Haladaptatus pallidirubidus]|uniref:Uncharacterized protein n=1 Tax=Haladaptatus pallidirubidus TaxID=1008152 RepID=A0AAV3UP69_9EURY|nr:hypothetical protein [Haladaptatus pallidirubidus]